MHAIWLVSKQEIVTTLQKRSFWIMTFLFPGIIILLNIGTQVVARNAFEGAGDLAITNTGLAQPGSEMSAVGYVDLAEVIGEIPLGIPLGMLTAYAEETDAQSALQAGEIDQYYLIPADYVAAGDLVLVDREYQPFNLIEEEFFNYVLAYNLSGDAVAAAVFLEPTDSVVPHALAPAEAGRSGGDEFLTFIVPFATMFIFFFLITMSSGFMLQSVSREKENRTVEVLLLSLRPQELMVGKILGLSVVALMQMVVWVGVSFLALDRGREMMEMAAAFTLPPGFLLWGLLYFLLGYLLYASIMGSIGALAPNAREGGQFTFMVILPLLIPIWLNYAFIANPNGPLPTALSLIPFTAPTSMMTRLAAGDVPLWQLLVSLGGLALTTYLFVLLAARFFRADNLLSDASFNWRRLVTGWRQ